mmetsp:Transcript_9827/g.10896  ORF Transcript_9827/g.10896 Transcript_9827/m.10896 type:complete len:101 (+) Transcript_9827:278-580(+)
MEELKRTEHIEDINKQLRLEITELDATIKDQDEMIANRDSMIHARDKEITIRDEMIEALRRQLADKTIENVTLTENVSRCMQWVSETHKRSKELMSMLNH